MDGVSTILRLQNHFETVYLLTLGPMEALVVIWTISEGLKAQSTLEPPNCFEPKTPG